MRDEDNDTAFSRPAQAELVDIHRRLDLLNERMHGVELQLARGARFPAWGGAVLVAVMSHAAATIYWGGKTTATLDVVRAQAAEALSAIQEHMRTAGEFRSGVVRWQAQADNLEGRQRECSERVVAIMQRVDVIEERNRAADARWELLQRKGLLK